MIEQKTIASLKVGDTFLGFLMVRSAEQRTNQKGGRYLDLNLIDRTGEVNCKMWDGTVPPPPASSVVKVQAQVQEFNGRMQMKIDRMRAANESDCIDLSQLIPCAPESPETMRTYIDDTIASFKSEALQKLVREMLRLAGEELAYYPAAMRMHHAEKSGLLHHTTDMLHTAEQVLKCYPFLNADLLRAGVIVHDLAKIQEMASDALGNVSDYTRDGLLIGHLVRGVATLEAAAKNVGVSGEWVALLEHMIISHHGIPEYGSPKMPMFPEAEALHLIDNLDAKMNEMKGIQERTPEGAFSEKIPSLDMRRLYHPLYRDDAE